MHVLIVGLGGVSRVFRNWPERTLGRELVRAGHRVSALTYLQPAQPGLGLDRRREVIDGIEVYRLPPRIWPDHAIGAALAQIGRPDVVHIVHPRNVLAWGVVRRLQPQGVPLVWTWLGPYHDRWLVADRERPYETAPQPERLIFSPRDLLRRVLLEPRMARDHWRNYAIHAPLQSVAAFVPCSQHEADVLAGLGFAERPMTVVPLWLDMEFMHGPAPELGLELSRPIIPYIGQLTVRKCFDMVVGAMPAVVERFPQASFVFVTHNPEQRARLLQLATEAGVAANLHFLGTISEEEKLALLRASAVLPFPSRYEGFGLPILEGMAAGVPVVSTNIPVVNELICDGVDGLLTPYDDQAALTAAILRLLDDTPLRKRLVAGGRRAMIERFDPQQLTAQVIAVYEQVRADAAQGRTGQIPVRTRR